MCLLVGRIAGKQHSGVPEVSPEAYTCPETDYDTSQSVHDSGHEKNTCSNEEDDRNHRQCQWKRIRRDSEEFPGVCLGGTKRYTGGDNQGNGPSPGEKGHPCVSNSNQQCQAQRMIFQKDGVHDKDAGRKRSSDGTYAWERGNGYKGLRRNSDGGATYNEVESRAVKRKYEASVDGRRSPRVMYGSCKVAREKHMARMLWADEATHGHETRVVGREFEGLDGDNQTPFLNGCPSSHDLCISIKERPRKSSNRRESLDGKMGRANTMSLENGDYQGGHGSSVGVNELQVRSGKRAHEVHVGNGRVSARAAWESVDRKVTSSGGSPPPSHDSCKSFENTGMGAENARLRKNGEEEKDRDILKDRGRTRWADKERDLEKENLPKGEPKSVTVVDYSHVFAVTAPASKETSISSSFPYRRINQTLSCLKAVPSHFVPLSSCRTRIFTGFL